MSQIEDIAIDAIAPSPLNYRRTFDESALRELGESIAANGLIQPIRVRPVLEGEEDGVRYEVVVGERRWRAHKLVELPTIRAEVVEMTDDQVLEVQLIENLQRANPHPIEEAEAYARLRERGLTLAQIASKVGLSIPTVHQRLKLCGLIDPAREDFDAGWLDLGAIMAMAPLEAHVQTELLATLRDRHYRRQGWKEEDREKPEAAINAAAVQRVISDQFLRVIASAPFDVADEDLVASAPACAACPKRTGEQEGLFEAGDEDQCTDGDCWRSKLIAHFKRLKKSGEKCLTKAQAETAFHRRWESERVASDEHEYVGGQRVTVTELIDDEEPLVYGQDARTGEIRTFVAKAAVQRAVRARTRTPASSDEKKRKEQERLAKLETKRQRHANRTAILAVHEATRASNEDIVFLLRAVVAAIRHDVAKEICDGHGLEAQQGEFGAPAYAEAVLEYFETQKLRGQVALALEAQIRESVTWDMSRRSELLEACVERYGVDVVALEAAAAEALPDTKAKKQPKAKAA